MLNKSCLEFIDELASGAPVPGGGGASAYVGALGVALGSMVSNLTTGRKKYAAYEGDIQRILAECAVLQGELAGLVDKDAEVFAVLADAYSLPRGTDEEKLHKETVMESALLAASLVPLDIMKRAYEGLLLHGELARIGSRMAISDVGVGAQLLRSAVLGAAMNIFINAKSMKDRDEAENILSRTRSIMDKTIELADSIYAGITEDLI